MAEKAKMECELGSHSCLGNSEVKRWTEQMLLTKGTENMVA